MQSFNIHEAKTHLSKLLEKVAAGEEVIISRAGKPVAKLVPIDAKQSGKRKLGLLKGKIWIDPDFDSPLPEDILSAFEGDTP
jgi:prevent-host-death family protein